MALYFVYSFQFKKANEVISYVINSLYNHKNTPVISRTPLPRKKTPVPDIHQGNLKSDVSARVPAMSASIFQNKDAYLQNTYFQTHKREYGNFTPFYITVTICTLLFTFIIVINIVLGCCSRYSSYWADRHTGNRWIISLWTATPHKQPSLDYTELRYVHVPRQSQPEYPDQSEYEFPTAPPAYQLPQAEIEYSKSSEILELQPKRESAI